jgi:hypothetical protein
LGSVPEARTVYPLLFSVTLEMLTRVVEKRALIASRHEFSACAVDPPADPPVDCQYQMP